VIDYVREASERLREQLPAGRLALAEKKQALTDVKARLARYHERFERAANAGEEDLACERIKELREQETALKAEIAEFESQQVPSSDRDLDAVRARRYLRTLARFFRSRPRYEESLYEALQQHHRLRVAVLAKDLVEATLEFEGEIEPSDEDDSMSHGRPIPPGCGQPDHIGRRVVHRSCIPLESLAPASVRWLRENQGKLRCQCGCGEVIRLQPRHYWRGAPRHVHGHQNRRGHWLVLQLLEAGYLTTSEVARALGIGVTTLLRREGTLYPQAARIGGFRVYHEADVELLRRGDKVPSTRSGGKQPRRCARR